MFKITQQRKKQWGWQLGKVGIEGKENSPYFWHGLRKRKNNWQAMKEKQKKNHFLEGGKWGGGEGGWKLMAIWCHNEFYVYEIYGCFII
ncbi:hypothetical protein UXU46_02765 [Campylobacter jejuni]